MPKKTVIPRTEPALQGHYAQLTHDFAFKKVFASEEDKELLIALLNEFLRQKLAYPITDVAIQNPYIKGQTKGNRGANLDIRCLDSKGNRFIVEMQIGRQKYFIKRTLFYSCMAVANSGQKGKDWDFNYPSVYSLSFLSFDLDFGENNDEIVQYISLHNDEHTEIKYNYINLAFVRLPSFKKSIEECRNFRDRLIFSLCHAHEFKSKPKQFKGKFFDRLFELAKFANFTADELAEYGASLMNKYDYQASIAYAKEEGILQTAKSMLKDGLSLARVARITKLPKEQIMALR